MCPLLSLFRREENRDGDTYVPYALHSYRSTAMPFITEMADEECMRLREISSWSSLAVAQQNVHSSQRTQSFYHAANVNRDLCYSENRPVSVIGGDVTATEDGEVTIPLDDDVDEVRLDSKTVQR